jgi:serine/threonine protein kinase
VCARARPQIKLLIEHLLNALAALHGMHLMHRDLKTQNALVNGRGVLKVRALRRRRRRFRGRLVVSRLLPLGGAAAAAARAAGRRPVAAGVWCRDEGRRIRRWRPGGRRTDLASVCFVPLRPRRADSSPSNAAAG